jgi:carbon-monoxide dehydrogenase large subunit
MPYRTPLGYVYDSGDFRRALDIVLKEGDWDGFDERRRKSEVRGRLRGIGLAAAIEPAGGGPKGAQLPEFARIEAGSDGLVLTVGSGDAGQGHTTVHRQIVQGLLGWDGNVGVVASNTQKVPKGVGTFGSRTMGAAGHAIAAVARDIIAAARVDAARFLDADAADISFEDGRFVAVGTNRFVSLGDLCAETGARYRSDAFVATDAGTFPNGVHLAEVEVDPETGAVTVVSYVLSDDVGTVINPLLVEGQVHGGVAQGLGQALCERLVFDPRSGALLSGSFMDYAMPRAADLPFIKMYHASTPTQANALGAKGAGESGTVGALPTVMNAVCNALVHLTRYWPSMTTGVSRVRLVTHSRCNASSSRSPTPTPA